MFFHDEEDDEVAVQEQQAVQPQALVPTSVSSAVDEFVEEQQPEAFDAQMSEAERRLEKAQYYRLLLNQKLFSDNSEAASDIESELREFIRQRLGVLLGITPERKVVTVENQFSPEEATVLKEIAAKLLKSPQTLAKVKEAPRLNTVSGPVKPEMRQIQAKPVAAPTKQLQPKKRPGPKPTPTGENLTVDNVVYYKVVDGKNGEHYVDEAGQKYKVATVPSGPNEGKAFMQNITGQSKPKGIKGFPTPTTPEQLQAAQQTMAMQSLGSTEKSLQKSALGSIVNEVLK